MGSRILTAETAFWQKPVGNQFSKYNA